MNIQHKGWLIGIISCVYGVLRIGNWLEVDGIKDILALGLFLYAIFLTKFSIKKED